MSKHIAHLTLREDGSSKTLAPPFGRQRLHV